MFLQICNFFQWMNSENRSPFVSGLALWVVEPLCRFCAFSLMYTRDSGSLILWYCTCPHLYMDRYLQEYIATVMLHACWFVFVFVFVFLALSLLNYIQWLLGTHSSTLAWKLPWMEEPGRLQSMGSLRVRHDWATSLSLFTFMHWRRKWEPTRVFLPGESQGRGSLVGCRLWGHTETDTTEAT